MPETDAPKEALFALNDALGFQRCVIVQPSCLGFDHRTVEDALAQRPQHCRAVALLPVDVAEHELARLDAAGFRGVRFNFMAHLGASVAPQRMLGLAARLRPFGWHLQVHAQPQWWAELAAVLACSPVPVVIDHPGRVDASLGLPQPAWRVLGELMRDERFWIKLSGLDRITRQGPPYADAQPFAREMAARFGDRVLWGSDWPHPNHAGPPPDDAQLVALIDTIVPDAAARRRLLVDNPQRLYRFI